MTDSTLRFNSEHSQYGPSITLNICNRFDFLNLQFNVTFNWELTEDFTTIASGSFSPDCAPHQSTQQTLQLPSLPNTDRLYILYISATDAQDNTFLRQSIPVGPPDLTERMLTELPPTSADPMTLVQDGILVRAGRKATMAEKLKVGDKRLERYLLHLQGTQAGPIRAFVEKELAGNATHYSFTLTPDTTDTFLSELGIAFLLDPKIDRVQWIGHGPMPTYPGRFRAGRYGLWALQQDDLYFEGNRRGVDAALLTDASGGGLLLFCRQGNISFEQTDRGIVLTYNAVVAGEGPKFARTAFPVVAKQVGTASGEFWLYHVDADHVPQLIHQLFNHPRTIPEPFHPFETQYDTYLMRYSDITD